MRVIGVTVTDKFDVACKSENKRKKEEVVVVAVERIKHKSQNCRLEFTSSENDAELHCGCNSTGTPRNRTHSDYGNKKTANWILCLSVTVYVVLPMSERMRRTDARNSKKKKIGIYTGK